MSALELVDKLVVERRDRPIVLGAQALEPGLARVNDERRGARRLHRFSKGEQGLARLLLVHSDAALDRDGNIDRRNHRRHAFGDQPRLAHEAGAEASALHPVGRTAAIEIDLVIAELGADARCFRKPPRRRSAELKRHGMLARVEADQPLARAEYDRIRGHHLRIEQSAAREDTMERPAAPVGPVHHRGHGKACLIGSRHGAHIGKTASIVANGGGHSRDEERRRTAPGAAVSFHTALGARYAAAPRSGRSGKKSTVRKPSPAITAPTVKAPDSPAR